MSWLGSALIILLLIVMIRGRRGVTEGFAMTAKPVQSTPFTVTLMTTLRMAITCLGVTGKTRTSTWWTRDHVMPLFIKAVASHYRMKIIRLPQSNIPCTTCQL